MLNVAYIYIESFLSTLSFYIFLSDTCANYTHTRESCICVVSVLVSPTITYIHLVIIIRISAFNVQNQHIHSNPLIRITAHSNHPSFYLIFYYLFCILLVLKKYILHSRKYKAYKMYIMRDAHIFPYLFFYFMFYINIR